MAHPRVERDPCDAHRLLITVDSAFGEEAVSIHEADAAGLIDQIRDALRTSAFEVWRQRNAPLSSAGA